jgi:hypothetical protein
MGMLKCLVMTCIKVAAAPVYVPYKICQALDDLNKPSGYNWWYHDSGREPAAGYQSQNGAGEEASSLR